LEISGGSAVSFAAVAAGAISSATARIQVRRDGNIGTPSVARCSIIVAALPNSSRLQNVAKRSDSAEVWRAARELRTFGTASPRSGLERV
jgi:hypothetical protein